MGLLRVSRYDVVADPGVVMNRVSDGTVGDGEWPSSAADLDEAIEIARAHPMARGGRLELRPFADFEQ